MALIDKLTNIADAIRGKTGGTDPLTLDAMAEAITSIEAGGVELPTLEHPAEVADVVRGMEFIGADVTAKTGTMPSFGLDGISEANERSAITEGADGHKELVLIGNTINSKRSYVDPDSTISVYMNDTDDKMSMFGDARPEDVVEGKTFTSEEGFTIKGTHACAGGTGSKPIILQVEKVISDTYVNSTSYTSEQFILLDIYPKIGGTVTVTYGDLTKTIVDDGTSETPPAQQVFFGTFGGVADEVETPASGTLTINGDYAAFGVGVYASSSKDNSVCGCITEVVSFGEMDYIPDNCFGSVMQGGCEKLEFVNLPYNLKSIGSSAFAECTNLQYLAIPHGITNIPKGLLTFCSNIRDLIIPDSVTTISNGAFIESCLTFVTIPASVTEINSGAFSLVYQLRYVRLLAATPPALGGQILDDEIPVCFEGFIVPFGCGDAYKTAEGWSAYADYILEEVPVEEETA